jgi:tetratricopeptide (TPR) repeat protein
MKKGVVMNRRCFLLMVALFSSLLLVYGCGDDDGGVTQTLEELIRQGWAKFDAGDFSGASADFNAANGLSADTSEAYLGLGWAELMQGKAGLAEDAFEAFLAKVSGSNDARAGLALAYDAQYKFEETIDKAEELLSSDPTWTFSHDSETNYLDVALVLAYGYYLTADFSHSLETVQRYFDPSFSADIDTPQGLEQLGEKLWSVYTG